MASTIIDTHTHLDSFQRKGILDAVLERAATAGVTRMITVGTDPNDWDIYKKLSTLRADIDYTVGLHPCSVAENWKETIDRLAAYFEELCKPVALGEIGLDRFHLPKDPDEAATVFQLQIEAFRAQLHLAKDLEIPVVIHSRGAFADCVKVIDESRFDWSRVVFHCFSDGPGEMKQLMERGGYGSFTGIITFKNAEAIREAALFQGLDRLMVETDAPYLAPMPHRGKRNEPSYLAHTAAFCADLFHTSLETLAETTSHTARQVYRLS